MSVEGGTIPCGVLRFRDDGTIVSANDTLGAWFGKSPEEFRNERVESLLTVAGRVFLQTHFFPLVALHGHADEIFLTLGCPSGALPVVASARRRETSEGRVIDCAFLPVPQRRKYEDEILAARKSAEEALQSNAHLDRAKREVEAHAVQLEQQLQETRRQNEELQGVVEILSHDLREPIRKIRLFSELARLPQHGANEVAGGALQKIEELAAHTDSLASAIRSYLAVDTEEPMVDVPLGQVIRQSAELAAATVEYTDWELTVSALPTIQARRDQLVLLFCHLFQNAIKFRDPARPLKVNVRGHVRQENIYQFLKGRYVYADYADIEVLDNGRSFDPKYGDYVFRLLKKADVNSSGLGVGLAICRKVVISHGGTLRVYPTPGSGTRFQILLPVARAQRSE